MLDQNVNTNFKNNLKCLRKLQNINKLYINIQKIPRLTYKLMYIYYDPNKKEDNFYRS